MQVAFIQLNSENDTIGESTSLFEATSLIPDYVDVAYSDLTYKLKIAAIASKKDINNVIESNMDFIDIDSVNNCDGPEWYLTYERIIQKIIESCNLSDSFGYAMELARYIESQVISVQKAITFENEFLYKITIVETKEYSFDVKAKDIGDAENNAYEKFSTDGDVHMNHEKNSEVIISEIKLKE